MNRVVYISGLGAVAFQDNEPGYYVDAELKALRPVKIYNYPGGTVLSEAQTGSIVGEIYSWIERSGNVWWQLKEGGYVLHQKGYFDATIAKNTSQGKADDILDAAFGAGGFDLPDLDQLKKIGWIVGGVIVGSWGLSLYLQNRAVKEVTKSNK